MAKSENKKSKKDVSADSASENEAENSDKEEEKVIDNSDSPSVEKESDKESTSSEEESVDSSDDDDVDNDDDDVEDDDVEDDDNEDDDDDDDDDDNDDDDNDDEDDEDDDDDDDDDNDDEDNDDEDENKVEVSDDQALTNSPNEQATSVKVAQKPLNLKAASLVFIVMATLSVLATNTFYDQGILLIAGIFLFLGAYPAIKLDVKDPTKKFSIEMALIFALCMILFVILRTLFPENTDDKDHAKIVIIILTVMATRLIVWPIYTFTDDE